MTTTEFDEVKELIGQHDLIKAIGVWRAGLRVHHQNDFWLLKT